MNVLDSPMIDFSTLILLIDQHLNRAPSLCGSTRDRGRTAMVAMALVINLFIPAQSDEIYRSRYKYMNPERETSESVVRYHPCSGSR